jgi:ribonuclease HI
MKNTLYLFTDGSANTQTKNGYGAYLWVSDIDGNSDDLNNQVETVKFERTSSTKLEIQTLIYALSKLEETSQSLIIFTDSQNMVGLLDRREKLEAQNYRSKKNEQIDNALLYKTFYQLHDKLQFEIIKVKGHKKTNQKDNIDRIFTIVDRAARNALRKNYE